jgi:Xaa-Pro aminopeptidase
MANALQTELILEAFNVAVWNWRPATRLAHHSDRDALYTSLAFSRRCREAEIVPSMGTVGDAHYNTIAEACFATFEMELLKRQCLPRGARPAAPLWSTLRASTILAGGIGWRERTLRRCRGQGRVLHRLTLYDTGATSPMSWACTCSDTKRFCSAEVEMRQRLLHLVETAGLDAVVATSFENVYYASGAQITTQRLIPDRLAAVIWSPTRSPAFVVCSIETSLARRNSWLSDVRSYEEFVTSPTVPIAEAIREATGGDGTIGVETQHLATRYMEELRAALPKARFVSADALFSQARAIKEADEIRRLESAAQATDLAISEAFNRATVGQKERDVAADIQHRLLIAGSEGIPFCVLASGENTAHAHPNPSSKPLEDGDLLRVDVGGSFGGYFSDLARTMVVGTASGRQRDAYARLWDVHETVIQAVKPGVRASALFRLCEDRFRQVGLTFRMPHIGHSLGIGLHEYPLLRPQEHAELAPGMVLAIEPLHFEETGERYHVEDLVEVTATGHRILSRAGKWDKLLELGAARHR